MTTRQPACGYVRTSTSKQSDRDGPERQRAAIARYANENGYDIDESDWYEDAVSGTCDDKDRPAYLRMIGRLAGNGCKTVIVENADRLARAMVVQEVLLDQLTEMGVSVLDSSGNDLSVLDGDPTRRLIRQLLGAIAEYAKEMLRLRMAASRAKIRREKGRCEGEKPYGEKPGEMAVVLKIAELRRNGATGQAIVDALHAQGLRSRKGSPWSGPKISVIARRYKLRRGRRRQISGNFSTPPCPAADGLVH